MDSEATLPIRYFPYRHRDSQANVDMMIERAAQRDVTITREGPL